MQKETQKSKIENPSNGTDVLNKIEKIFKNNQSILLYTLSNIVTLKNYQFFSWSWVLKILDSFENQNDQQISWLFYNRIIEVHRFAMYLDFHKPTLSKEESLSIKQDMGILSVEMMRLKCLPTWMHLQYYDQ